IALAYVRCKNIPYGIAADRENNALTAAYLQFTFSLPFNRARRFAGDVEADAVDAFDFIHNAAGDFFEKVVGKFYPVGSHAVLRFDGAQGDGVIVGAFVAHHAYAANRKEDGEALPNLVIPTTRFHFLDDDGVGGAQDFATALGDFAKDADG